MDPNGTWNGLVGMGQRGEVDLLVAGLTISAERSEAITFTHPFTEAK